MIRIIKVDLDAREVRIIKDALCVLRERLRKTMGSTSDALYRQAGLVMDRLGDDHVEMDALDHEALDGALELWGRDFPLRMKLQSAWGMPL